MPTVNQEVLAQLRRELQERPDLSDGVLRAFAAAIDPSLATMELRAFHARYVVAARSGLGPISRSKRRSRNRARASTRTRPARRIPIEAAASPPAPPTTTTPRQPRAAVPATRAVAREPTVAHDPAPPSAPARPSRGQVRLALLAFASAMAEAHGGADLVRVLTEVDRFVEDALAGT